MDSIEIYDYKQSKWIPYVPDHKKWGKHFVEKNSEGKMQPDHKGRYIVGSGSRWRPATDPDTPKVELLTSVAQAIEMAKSKPRREGETLSEEKRKNTECLTIS